MTRNIKTCGLVLALALVCLLLLAPAADEARLTIYSAQGASSLSVVERDGKQYVVLIDALQPLGATIATRQGNHWKLRFTAHGGSPLEAEFTDEKTRVKLHGKKLELADPLVLERDRALVSLGSLADVISALVNLPVEFHASSRRLFIGPVATPFTTAFEKGAAPRLELHFPKPVSPFIASEPGKIRMVFSREPIVSGTRSFNFADSSITSATYSEGNGTAQIEIDATVPLIARFGDEGKTISIEPAPASAAAKPPPAASPTLPPTASPFASGPTSTAPAPAPAQPAVHTFLVVIDASHGGQETGAFLTPSLAEKEVALALARHLHADLEARGIRNFLIRDGDVTLSSEQRAVMANGSHATVYISLHAGSAGSGVRLYSARLTPTPARPGGFLPWDTAQGAYLEQSRALVGSVMAELNNRHIPVVPLTASLRPLDNVALAGMAIEVAPWGGKIESVNSPAYQAAITNAVALGIANARYTLEPSR
ncbi:MAG TPA: N-acetylmuramoyl-L-alanine amidase [Terriglobales bacterium]|nr:N-acetylmuramoyl-L-alanine amidase [Terriglobales bacterium]